MNMEFNKKPFCPKCKNRNTLRFQWYESDELQYWLCEDCWHEFSIQLIDHRLLEAAIEIIKARNLLEWGYVPHLDVMGYYWDGNYVGGSTIEDAIEYVARV